MNFEGIFAQLAAMAVALVGAPLLAGWVNQCRAWLQNRKAPPLLQPFHALHKLFWKESVVAHEATAIYRLAPYVVFACMLLAAMIIPTLSTNLPMAPAADAIALVGIFALARLFVSLAAMDVGTAFGSLGARREMLIGFLAEPAFLMVLFTASLISSSTSLATIVSNLAHRDFAIQPAEFIHKNAIGFLAGNVIKYVCRHGKKNGIEDLKKARHYVDLLIEHEYGNT